MTPNVQPPSISIIVPVFNGCETLHRAIRSVADQTFPDWELLAIDDCSTDGSAAILQSWAKQDARIRLLRTPENSGQCAARNLGLKNARGEFVCYLDQDDEFYPDYLARIDQSGPQGDVLVFRLDLIRDDAPPETWRPETAREEMFLGSIAPPLGVAHRRKLVERVGGFNELLWTNEEADLWRRFARAGAEFVFIAHKSGRFRLRADRTGRLTRKQRETLEANQKTDRPLFGEPSNGRGRPIEKIAFVSPHCAIDFTNGAAVATFAGLKRWPPKDSSARRFAPRNWTRPKRV